MPKQAPFAMERLTFRRRRSVSFCLFCDVRPALFYRWRWTFSCGNRACSLFFSLKVGMFFSSFLLNFGSAKVHIFFNMAMKNYSQQKYFSYNNLIQCTLCCKNKFFQCCLKNYLYLCISVSECKKMLKLINKYTYRYG